MESLFGESETTVNNKFTVGPTGKEKTRKGQVGLTRSKQAGKGQFGLTRSEQAGKGASAISGTLVSDSERAPADVLFIYS